MPPPRRNRKDRTPHAEIPTPSWRPFVPPSSPNASELSLSSDNTNDGAYIEITQPLALEERERWAGPTRTSDVIRKRASALSKANKPIRPLFPTPLEAVQILSRAKMKFARQNPTHAAAVRSARQGVLASLQPSLKPYVAMETLISQQRRELRAALADLRNAKTPSPRALHSPGSPSELSSPAYEQMTSPDGEVVTFKLTSGASQNHHPKVQSPNAPAAISGPVILCEFLKRSLVQMDRMEAFLHTSSADLLQVAEQIAQQADCELTRPITFTSLQSDILAAKKFDDDSSASSPDCPHTQPAVSLGEFISREIDPQLYPSLASTFQLDPQYRFDGKKRRDSPSPQVSDADPTQQDPKMLATFDIDLSVLQQNSAEPSSPQQFVVTTDYKANKRRLNSMEENLSFEQSSPSLEQLHPKRYQENNKRRKHQKARRDRKERKSFRILDVNAESLRSERSDHSVPSPSSSDFHPQVSHAVDQPDLLWQPVVNLEADDEHEPNPHIVELDIDH